MLGDRNATMQETIQKGLIIGDELGVATVINICNEDDGEYLLKARCHQNAMVQ